MKQLSQKINLGYKITEDLKLKNLEHAISSRIRTNLKKIGITFEEAKQKYQKIIQERKERKNIVDPLIIKREKRNKYISLKSTVKEIITTQRNFVQSEYCVGSYELYDFLNLGVERGLWELSEETNFDKKNRGYFSTINVLGYGNGYMIVENFMYTQWKSREHSTSRRNKFIFGFTEEGKPFLKAIKNIKTDTLKKIIFAENEEEAKRLAYKVLTGIDITNDDILQGDVVVKKLKRKKEVKDEKMINEFNINGSHVIFGKLHVIDNYDKILYIKEGYIYHKNREHNTKYIPEGFYRIYEQNNYFTWNFSGGSVD